MMIWCVYNEIAFGGKRILMSAAKEEGIFKMYNNESVKDNGISCQSWRLEVYIAFSVI